MFTKASHCIKSVLGLLFACQKACNTSVHKDRINYKLDLKKLNSILKFFIYFTIIIYKLLFIKFKQIYFNKF